MKPKRIPKRRKRWLAAKIRRKQERGFNYLDAMKDAFRDARRRGEPL